MSQRHTVRKLFLLGTASTALLAGCDPGDTTTPEVLTGSDSQEIVGGTNASISTYPWQVSFQRESGSHWCGGSILNAHWILTAQHCVEFYDEAIGVIPYATAPVDLARIVAGSSTLSTNSSLGQHRNITDIIRFPGYTEPVLGKDVALMRLSTPLTFNTNVQAIAMATPADEAAGLTKAGVTATVTGWGALSEGGPGPDTLQAVNVPIVSNATADAAYNPEDITADQLAAGLMGVGGKDSCQGDSGGPLVVSKGSGKILAGVVSWGEGCARPEYPGMYARVASFQPWISSFLNKAPTSLLSQSSESVSAGTWKHFTITVPSGTKSLNVLTSGGTGDADLYVHTSKPTPSVYTCRPFLEGSSEYCSIPNPAPGTWYVSLKASSTFSGLTVRANIY